jgi:hypothetical protein
MGLGQVEGREGVGPFEAQGEPFETQGKPFETQGEPGVLWLAAAVEMFGNSKAPGANPAPGAHGVGRVSASTRWPISPSL